MFRNKILVLAIAGIILAVGAVGSASASAYHYTGSFDSSLDYSGGYYSTSTNNPPSNGHFYGLSTGTYVDWYNRMSTTNNIQYDSISAYATQYTVPLNGLSWSQPTYSILKGTSTPQFDYEVYVLDSGSHTIFAQHKYAVTYPYPTATDDQMAFN